MYKYDTAVVDADSLLYIATSSKQETYYTINTTDETISQLRFQDKHKAVEYSANHCDFAPIVPNAKLTGTLEDAADHFKSLAKDITSTVKAKSNVFFIGNEEPTFRDKLASIATYKGNREGRTPLLLLKPLKEYLIEHEMVNVADVGFEADDLVIITTKMLLDAGETPVLCGRDKDALQFPCHHYNYNKDEFLIVTELEGLSNFYSQMLTGDTVDNIKGLFGVGKASAHVKHIKNHKTEGMMFNYVYDEYKKRFGNHTDLFFDENFVLLYMCRTNDTDEGYKVLSKLK